MELGGGPRRRALALAGWLAVTGCAPALPPTSPLPDPGASPPWEIPPAAFATQRLFRVAYDGPEGEGGLRLTLRLAEPGRYQVETSDALGRPVWALEAARGGGRWIDHRQRRACRIGSRLEMEGLPLSPFPLLALPPLLLGRLPAAPAGEAARRSLAGTAGSFDFRDDEGRRWTGAVAAGAPVRWSLWEEEVSAPRISWLERGGEAILSDRGRGVQVRWRQVVAEPLTLPLAELAMPDDYAVGQCAAAADLTAP